MGSIGVFPGTFNPITVGHLAIADAAHGALGLDRLDLVLSEAPLNKHDQPDLVPLAQRVAVVELALGDRPWATVRITPHQLIADIARGYDVVVLGADKWVQVNDPAFYGGDPATRDAAVASLPRCAIAPRHGHCVPAHLVLDVPEWVSEVSSTAVRHGRTDWHGATGDQRATNQ